MPGEPKRRYSGAGERARIALRWSSAVGGVARPTGGRASRLAAAMASTSQRRPISAPRETQDALGDDVAVDLGRPARDRHGPHVEAVPAPTPGVSLGPEDLARHFGDVALALAPQQFGHARLGPH